MKLSRYYFNELNTNRYELNLIFVYYDYLQFYLSEVLKKSNYFPRLQAETWKGTENINKIYSSPIFHKKWNNFIKLAPKMSTVFKARFVLLYHFHILLLANALWFILDKVVHTKAGLLRYGNTLFDLGLSSVKFRFSI